MKKPLPHITVALTGLLLSGTVAAQDERWFKVEVMIFSQRSEAAATAEDWQPTPKLQYPGESRFLLNTTRIADNAAMYDGVSVVDKFGRQLITLNRPANEEIIQPQAASEDINPPLNTERPEVTPPPATPTLTPTPFTVLDADAREFNSKASAMARSGRYNILFHETWAQPMVAKTDTLPIVVDRSGDNQAWPTLQGSIKLYLSRYLHIETNLWLNTMGEYLPEYWIIPAPPLGPPSLIIEEPEAPWDALIVANDAAAPSTEVFAEEPAENLGDSETLAVDSGPVYPWHHAILLQQKRKMRSTEVHYIDHPMLGVVALITPLNEDDLEAMAAAEVIADPNQPAK
jgi:hypothetical protein